MSATTWFIIAIVGFSLSGISLIVAIFMFLKMNIPAVIGDLSGKTVAREIKAMRAANASSGSKLHKSSSVNVNRGKLTEAVNGNQSDSYAKAAAHASKRMDGTGFGQTAAPFRTNAPAQYAGTPAKVSMTESFSANVSEVNIPASRETEVLPQDRMTDVLTEERATEVLYEAPATAVLVQERQTEVLAPSYQTEILQDNSFTAPEVAGTTVLNEAEPVAQQSRKPVTFQVTKSVVRVHTDEVV